MKILLPLLVAAGVTAANELDRIEGIVSEVTKLRQNHELCEAELTLLKSSRNIKSDDERTAAFERELEAERQQCENRIGETVLQRDSAMKKLTTARETITALQEKIRSHEKGADACQRSLKRMNDERKSANRTDTAQVTSLQTELEQLRRQHAEAAKAYDTRILKLEAALAEAKKSKPCERPDSVFPKLLMKEGYAQPKAKPSASEAVKVHAPGAKGASAAQEPRKLLAPIPEASEFFKAAAFRITADAAIYDAPGGVAVDTWETGTSFTSGERRGAWIRITGYFVDRKWHSCKAKQWWIEAKHTLKRQGL